MRCSLDVLMAVCGTMFFPIFTARLPLMNPPQTELQTQAQAQHPR
jgi:hypothetical protein